MRVIVLQPSTQRQPDCRYPLSPSSSPHVIRMSPSDKPLDKFKKIKRVGMEKLSDALTTGSRVMVVGALSVLDGFLEGRPADSVISVEYANLTPATVARVRPDLVLAPLLGPGFDILDIGARLDAMGYQARLRAVTLPLPDADAVVREVRMQFRNLDFALIELPDETPFSG